MWIIGETVVERTAPGLIENVWSQAPGKTLKNWLTRPHNSGRAQRCTEASRVERLPHPAYNPGVATSDFFLFGYIKEKLSDYSCEGLLNFLNAVTEIPIGVDQDVLLSVFKSWINLLA
jgi:hypothetical protein